METLLEMEILVSVLDKKELSGEKPDMAHKNFSSFGEAYFYCLVGIPYSHLSTNLSYLEPWLKRTLVTWSVVII